MNKEQITDRDIQDFEKAFCPFGYQDIKKAIQTANDAGKDYNYAVEVIEEFAESTGTKISDIDPVYCVYDALHQEARTEIENATGKDICNDKPYYSITIYGNYMCTAFDGSEEANKALHDLIDTIPEDDRSKVVEWLKSETEY